jgi:opacity protein-like surface antigen
VWGGRIGYTPFDALSGEIVLLTGSNEAAGASGSSTDPKVRLTLAELSFVVNFRTLFNSRWYPFVDLGAGVAARSSKWEEDGARVFDGSKLAFHLGGGIKVDLAPRATLRFNFRDTFHTETRSIDGQDIQDTLDAVELTAGLEYRIPISPRRGPKRLR